MKKSNKKGKESSSNNNGEMPFKMFSKTLSKKDRDIEFLSPYQDLAFRNWLNNYSLN
jgi:hypothetical protein